MVWKERVAEKGWVEEKQSPPSSKAQSLSRASHKGKREPENSKKRTASYAGQPRQTHKQQADFGHTWKKGTRKAQTSPANTDTVRSWVRGKRAWFDGGERGKTYFEVPAWALWGEVSCWDDIPPKRSKVELDPLGARHKG